MLLSDRNAASKYPTEADTDQSKMKPKNRVAIVGVEPVFEKIGHSASLGAAPCDR